MEQMERSFSWVSRVLRNGKYLHFGAYAMKRFAKK
jgi:hypothetical protein